jgi:transposase
MYNRKDKEKELMNHHSKFLEKLTGSYQFAAKTAFYSKGKFGRQIQFFENELNKSSDIYVELVDIERDAQGHEINMIPMFWERPLFKYRYNPYFKEEYEVKTSTNSRGDEYSVYVIPTSELVCVNKGSEEIPYNVYDSQRTEEPKEQKKLSVFPDFEEEFVPKLKTQETDEDVSAILLQIAEGFQKLAQKLK